MQETALNPLYYHSLFISRNLKNKLTKNLSKTLRV